MITRSRLLFFAVLLFAFVPVAHAGWLGDLTNWIRPIVVAFFNAIRELAFDIVLFNLSVVVDVTIAIVQAIPVPTFLDGYSICTILNGGGSVVMWAVVMMRVPEGMLLISGAFAFYLVRKVLTLFQW